MAKTYFEHNEIQDLLFSDSGSSETVKKKRIKSVLNQFSLNDEFSWLESLMRKPGSLKKKLQTFSESFELSGKSSKKLRDMLYMVYSEEDAPPPPSDEDTDNTPPETEEPTADDGEIPPPPSEDEEEMSEEPDTSDDSEESSDTEDDEEESSEMNISEMSSEDKLDLMQKIIDSVEETDFDDFMNAVEEMIGQYSMYDKAGSEETEEEDSEEDEEWPDFDDED